MSGSGITQAWVDAELERGDGCTVYQPDRIGCFGWRIFVIHITKEHKPRVRGNYLVMTGKSALELPLTEGGSEPPIFPSEEDATGYIVSKLEKEAADLENEICSDQRRLDDIRSGRAERAIVRGM